VEQPLTYLQQRAGEDWLIGYNSHQFHYLTEQLCQQLTQLSQGGTPPKILLAEENPWQFLAAFLAAVAANCPVFLCNPQWVEREWQQVLDLVQPDLIFGAASKSPPNPPFVRGGASGDGREISKGAEFDREVCQQALIFIPTGGSSGKIRFAIHTWQTLMASVAGFHQYFEQKPINSFCVLPLYHVSGLMQFLRSLTTGGRIVIMPFKALTEGRRQEAGGRRQEAIPMKKCFHHQVMKVESSLFPVAYYLLPTYKSDSHELSFTTKDENLSFSASPRLRVSASIFRLEGEECNIDPKDFFLSLVPTQLARLMSLDACAWLSGFRTVLLGGAPPWNSLLEDARLHKIPLAPTYGMTETASGIVTLKPEAFLSGNNSSGQVLPHAQVTIRNTTGQILDAKQTGMISIQANSLALGYYEESESLKPQSAIGNFPADDLGFFDEQGYLHVIGRRSNKIITGGENVFPAEVEAAIQATQMVTDVCVIGIPDSDWGQVVTAIYVPFSGTVSPRILKTAIEDKLSKYKQPKHWISVATLPRNAQGKVNYEQLQEIVNGCLTI